MQKHPPEAASHFILVANDSYGEDWKRRSAFDIAEERLERKEWAIYSTTRNRRSMMPGDRVLIYIAGSGMHRQCFVASARIESIERASRSFAGYETELGEVVAVLKLGAIAKFDPKNIHSISHQLSFFPVGNPKWGAILMGGARKISKRDFEAILG